MHSILLVRTPEVEMQLITIYMERCIVSQPLRVVSADSCGEDLSDGILPRAFPLHGAPDDHS